MAANAWTIHNAMIEYLHDNSIDISNDAIVMRLYTSASNVNEATRTDASTATNEVTQGNGYLTGGTSVTISISRVAGVTTVTSTNGSWGAVGGPIVARYAAIIDTTPATDVILFSTLLDNFGGGQDVTAADTNSFIVQISPTGIYTGAQV